jgi:hypothetical protein
MEDITQGMKRPCLIDLKLASKPYNSTKIARQQFKIDQSTCATHGFRMCGYSTYDENLQRVFVDKYTGRLLKAENLQRMFSVFF